MLSTRMSSSVRRLIFLIAATTVVPLATLLWVGWQLLEQDRILEHQQIQQRVERSADLVVAALQRAIADAEQQLAVESQWADGAVAVTFEDGGVNASPPGRLAYVPTVRPLPEATEAAFAAADGLEFRDRDHRAAIALLRTLVSSRDDAIRAGALLRLARNLARVDRDEEALATYTALAQINDAGIAGVPAGLVGRYALCRLLEQRQRSTELEAASRALMADLRSGRWALTAPMYQLYVGDAAKWSGVALSTTREEALAEAVELLWERWQSMRGQRTPQSGRESITVGSEPIAVFWQASNDVLRALVATRPFVESQFLSAINSVAQEQRVNVALQSIAGESAVNAGVTDKAAAVSRSAVDSGLPWRITIARLDPIGSDRAFATRRRLLVAGFVLIVGMALVASYLIVRAVARELAVGRLQSDFVSAVSHEFRTPLTSLRQFTDMLREQRVVDNDRRRIAYDALSRATDRLTRLVESLLDFGRMEAGARRYTFEPTDCSAIVQGVVDDFRSDTRASRYQVVLGAHESAMVSVDREAMARAVWNLLDNAVKYSPSQSAVEVGIARQNGSIRVMVRDHGIGIPAHERERVFAKFHRGEEARRRGIKGTGIGLAMVNEIVKAHHGHVEVASEPAKGSTFTIVLPAGD